MKTKIHSQYKIVNNLSLYPLLTVEILMGLNLFMTPVMISKEDVSSLVE